MPKNDFDTIEQRNRLEVIHATINEAIKYGFTPLEFEEEELVDISDFFDTFLYS